MFMVIMVVDGQGGGIGKALIEKLKPAVSDKCDIIAVGTNSLASAAMLKAGVSSVATGENAIMYNAHRADIIVGSIGIVSANSMLGELSPNMANAISSSDAVKILIPMNRCNLKVVGVTTDSLPKILDEAVAVILSHVDGKSSSKGCGFC